MDNIFGFVNDIGNYESRKVGRWDSPDGTIAVSTARVSDGKLPFETCIFHPDYHKGGVIVEAYSNITDAREGHVKWTKLTQDDTLPDPLVDCLNSHIAQASSNAGNVLVWPRKGHSNGGQAPQG